MILCSACVPPLRDSCLIYGANPGAGRGLCHFVSKLSSDGRPKNLTQRTQRNTTGKARGDGAPRRPRNRFSSVFPELPSFVIRCDLCVKPLQFACCQCRNRTAKPAACTPRKLYSLRLSRF